MPEMDGLETIKAINQSKQIKHKPGFIMVTANLQEEIHWLEDSSVSKENNIFSIISKPFLMEELLGEIYSALDKKVPQQFHRQSHEVAEQKLNFNNVKVLLVEDNEINQELIIELLQGQDFNVTVANNGQEALLMLDKETFDGVLMDCQMPVLDGYEATKKIRQQPKFKNLPVIALTANALKQDIEKALASGMNDHIAKPIDPDKMFSTIGKWISPDNNDSEISANHTNASSALPDSLPGIVISVGLKICNSNEPFYKRLLLKFRDQKANSIEDFRIALSDNNPQSAQMLVHNLKSVSGNLGMLKLSALAASLEHKLKIGDADFNGIVEDIEQELDIIINGLSSLS